MRVQNFYHIIFRRAESISVLLKAEIITETDCALGRHVQE